MDVSTTVISTSSKTKQYSENDLKNYFYEYEQFLKVKKIFCKVISGYSQEFRIKNFGNGDYFTKAFRAFRLIGKGSKTYNSIVSDQMELQNTCEEYHAERKTMKLALSSILTPHLSKHQHLCNGDEVDELLDSLSPRAETPIKFGLILDIILDILKPKSSFESNESEPSSTQLPQKPPMLKAHSSSEIESSPPKTPRKLSIFTNHSSSEIEFLPAYTPPKTTRRSHSPESLRKLKKKISESLAKRPKDNFTEGGKSAPSVKFATTEKVYERLRSTSSPSHPHAIKKKTRDSHDEIRQKLLLIGNLLPDDDSTLIKLEDGSLKQVPGSINADAVNIILIELESYATVIPEQEQRLYCLTLKELPEYGSIKEVFAKRKDLFQKYLTLYIRTHMEDWCLDQKHFSEIMIKFRHNLINFMVPEPYHFYSDNVRKDIWELVEETKLQSMGQAVGILSDPIKQANLANDSLELLKIINTKLESMNSYLLAVCDGIKVFCQFLSNNVNLEKYMAIRSKKLHIYLNNPRANFEAIVHLLDYTHT